MAADGKSLSQIADMLNSTETKNIQVRCDSSPWTPRRISAVLSNRHYLGQIKYANSWVKGLHQAIIDEETFNQAQAATSLRRTTSTKQRSASAITYPLRGLVICPKCGRKLSIGTDVKQIDRLCKQVTTYYRCRSNAGGRKPCKGVRIQAWKLENRVIDALTVAIHNPSAIDRIESPGIDKDKFSQHWKLLDIPELMNVVAEDLLDCDPTRFDELQRIPDPDGSDTHWYNNYLLATPSDDWIASIVAVRALIELKAEEAIPLFVDLLFQTWRFPRLTVDVEAQYFFAPLGKIAIEPLCDAFEFSGPEKDEGRRDVV
jgi:hypothetical protein